MKPTILFLCAGLFFSACDLNENVEPQLTSSQTSLDVYANADGYNAVKGDPASIPMRLILKAEVLLSGASGPAARGMRAELQKVLPTSQPYWSAPFGYQGTEFIIEQLPNIVDWVLVELRDPTTQGIVVQRAALLTSAGEIVDLDGKSPVMFYAQEDCYSLVVRHRNHLGVISTEAVNFIEGFGRYSFITQREGQLQLRPGIYAMIKGNVNKDKVVNNTDVAALAAHIQQGYNYMQYSVADVNMDGWVDQKDMDDLAPVAAVGYVQSF